MNSPYVSVIQNTSETPDPIRELEAITNIEKRIANWIESRIRESEDLARSYAALRSGLDMQVTVEYEKADKIIPLQADSRNITVLDLVRLYNYSLVQNKARTESARKQARPLYKYADTSTESGRYMFSLIRSAVDNADVDSLAAIRVHLEGGNTNLRTTVNNYLKGRKARLLGSGLGEAYRLMMSGANSDKVDAKLNQELAKIFRVQFRGD